MILIKKNELFLLSEIVKKNFLSKYKESVLGIFWTILSPLLMMGLFTIIFSTLFARNIHDFPIYFLSGWCMFQFFNTAISSSMISLKGNKNILQSTSAPKHIFVLGSVISEFLNFLIMMLLLIVIMFITNCSFHFSTMFFAIIPIFCFFVMLTGVGFIVSIACVYYTDIRHLWSVLSLMFMYSSAIFYPMDIIPEPFYTYMCLNPLYWAIAQFRCFIYEGIFPDALNLLNFVLLSLIIFVVGIIIFKKYQKTIAMKF